MFRDGFSTTVIHPWIHTVICHFDMKRAQGQCATPQSKFNERVKMNESAHYLKNYAHEL